MAQTSELTLQVAELIHYCADVDAAVRFYRDRLRWRLVHEAPGNLALFDVAGVYRLALLPARWAEDWQTADGLPAPLLSLESRDLHADRQLLAQRGMPELEVDGTAETMLRLTIPLTDGLRLFAWQDSAGTGSGWEDSATAGGGGNARYALGECVYFVDAKEQAQTLLTDKLGFLVKFTHGSVYTALAIGDGPVVGLFDLPLLQRAPVFSPGPVRTRLFLECHDLQAEHRLQLEYGAAPGEVVLATDGLRWFSTADPDHNLMTFWQYKPVGPAGGQTSGAL